MSNGNNGGGQTVQISAAELRRIMDDLEALKAKDKARDMRDTMAASVYDGRPDAAVKETVEAFLAKPQPKTLFFMVTSQVESASRIFQIIPRAKNPVMNQYDQPSWREAVYLELKENHPSGIGQDLWANKWVKSGDLLEQNPHIGITEDDIKAFNLPEGTVPRTGQYSLPEVMAQLVARCGKSFSEGPWPILTAEQFALKASGDYKAKWDAEKTLRDAAEKSDAINLSSLLSGSHIALAPGSR